MDPVSIAITSAAVGGVAGKFVEKAWSLGEKWIAEYFKNHGKEAQIKAKENAVAFLTKVAEAVKIIQDNAKVDPVTLKVINNSFKDPDFSAILQKAIVTSARTSSKDKHKILARLVTERLLAKSEDMISLASSIAVEAIGALKAKHLYVLGLSVLVEGIRPMGLSEKLPQEQLNQIAREWWIKNLSPLIHKVEDLTDIDIRHLVGVNCIEYESFIGRDLKRVLKSGFGEWDVEKFVSDTEEGKKLKEYYDKYLQKMTLTSAGQLIGIYVKDQVIGIRTTINW
jgi:hypothetical protein